MGNLEGLVRPAVMIVLVLAQVALAVTWALGAPHAEPAFAALGSFTMVVIVYLFKSRDEEKRGAAGGTTVNTGTGDNAGVTVNTTPPVDAPPA